MGTQAWETDFRKRAPGLNDDATSRRDLIEILTLVLGQAKSTRNHRRAVISRACAREFIIARELAVIGANDGNAS